jgi:neutral ceramidase
VEIKLGLLRIGDITIGAVNAEVFNPIAERLKKESPYARTMMATLTNGMARSGYIPNDAAYGMDTFEVLSSRLKPGCAECAIVNGTLDLIESPRAHHFTRVQHQPCYPCATRNYSCSVLPGRLQVPTEPPRGGI